MAGDDHFLKQVPLGRCVPLWGGLGASGFAPVLFHGKKKLCTSDWVDMVQRGKLRAALRKASGKRRRPWVVVCDNERCVHSVDVMAAHTAAGIVLWHIPPRSPDLNPIERFWSWLRRRLLALDLKDAAARRPVFSKLAYRERVKSVLRSRRSSAVVIANYQSFRQVCQKVVNAR